MKTMYIPIGETVAYESVVTENLVVHGCLNVTYGVKAKHIYGNGVIHAGTIAANTIRADDLECSTITCDKLIARRVSAVELFASSSAAVSCFLSAAYVETGCLTVAISEISEIKADEVVNLKPKKHGMLRTLLASSLKAWWLSLWAPDEEEPEVVDAEFSAVPDSGEKQDEGAAFRAEVAKNVREILSELNSVKAKAEAKSEDEAEDGNTAPSHQPEDFELQRFVALFKLCRDSGYTLRLVPGTPEENAPVFDFDMAQMIQPAA